jgi:hypothetical protein
MLQAAPPSAIFTNPPFEAGVFVGNGALAELSYVSRRSPNDLASRGEMTWDLFNRSHSCRMALESRSEKEETTMSKRPRKEIL